MDSNIKNKIDKFQFIKKKKRLRRFQNEYEADTSAHAGIAEKEQEFRDKKQQF